MADLTPELLAQLERDAAMFESTTFEWRQDAVIDGCEIGDALVAHSGLDLYEIGTAVEQDVAEPLARLMNAAPALVAAAKERDQLLTRQQELLATVAKLSATTPYAEEVQGWEGQRAKMIAEVGTLRAEAVQLRAYLEEARWERNALQQRALQLRSHAKALLDCIDRKSYSSAAQQEAVRAAEAAIGGVS